MCMQDLVKSNCCFLIQITAYQSYRVCDFWVHPGRNYNWYPVHFRKVGHSREQSRKQEAFWAEDVRESGKGAGERKAEKESQLCVVEIPPAGKGGSEKKRLHNPWRTPARIFLPKNRSLGGRGGGVIHWLLFPLVESCLRNWLHPPSFSTSKVAQTVECLPAMWETGVRSLGREDPLEKERATHSSTLARRIPWMEEPGGLQSVGSQRVRHDWATSLSLSSPPSLALIGCAFLYIVWESCVAPEKALRQKPKKISSVLLGGTMAAESAKPPESWLKGKWAEHASVFSLFPFERRVFPGSGLIKDAGGEGAG